MSAEPKRSTGHIRFSADGSAEYYQLGTEVYRAGLHCVFDTRTGARIGRWECSRSHWDRYEPMGVFS